ncbi:MAG TPA: ABC transporter substrate-binding protein [Candidatus Binatia bacterium]|nr:ABC transporter substrate-binding protein [Candidatus Binatia bacterium]
MARMSGGKIWFALFVTGLSLLLAAPVLVLAQSPIRVGILVQEMERSQTQAIKGLGEELKRLGYEEKKNLFFETRNVKGNRAVLQPAAGEILARKVNAIFTTGTSATRAVIAATKEIPIVFVHPDDPVAAGFIKSNSERPPNLTGVAAYARATTEKRVELIKEIVPGLRKILVFYDGNNAFSRDSFAAAEAAAKKFSLEAVGYAIKSTDELKTTVASLHAMPATAIFQIPDELFESESEFLFETARAKKFPTMFNQETWAIGGALAAYGPNFIAMGRQAGGLIHKIVKGEKPETLAIERAAKFDLTLNYRTARFLDLKFTPEMLKKADKVIR